MAKVRPARERAARALCELEGHPPNSKMDGAPMWASYLPEVDAVLRAVLGDEAWAAMLAAEENPE